MPTGLTDVVAAYEIPYGAIERPADGEEEPGQRWIDVSGTVPGTTRRFGLAILNDAKYGFDIHDGELGVTAVRSPIYAHHEPTVPAEGVRYQFQDQGLQRFTLWLVPHRGEWADAGLTRRALELNQRPTALIESFHAGTLGSRSSFASVEPDHVILGAVKQAEDGEGLVVRLAETAGRPATATVRFPAWEREFGVEIGAFEIRTFRVPADAALEPIETDLLERPPAEAGSGWLRDEATVVPHGAEAQVATRRSRATSTD
jgi:alpha-mannosidase